MGRQLSPNDVAVWVAFMREHGLKRLVVKDLEIELGGTPSSSNGFTHPMGPQGLFEDATGSICSCGHSWITEHTEAGCLMGCSHDLCSSSGGEPDVR
jgi:hypothetical protein